ncbi:MAG: hypothetical protein AAGI01_18695, partial [Myxococcota bacterium]
MTQTPPALDASRSMDTTYKDLFGTLRAYMQEPEAWAGHDPRALSARIDDATARMPHRVRTELLPYVLQGLWPGVRDGKRGAWLLAGVFDRFAHPDSIPSMLRRFAASEVAIIEHLSAILEEHPGYALSPWAEFALLELDPCASLWDTVLKRTQLPNHLSHPFVEHLLHDSGEAQRALGERLVMKRAKETRVVRSRRGAVRPGDTRSLEELARE